MKTSKIHIFTMAWNEPFTGWLARFALPSLYQPANVPALVAEGHRVTHHVFTIERDIPAILEAGKACGASLTVQAFEAPAGTMLRQIQAALLIGAAERAMADDAIFVPAAASTIWSDGSLANVVHVCDETDCATAAIYLLADAEKMAENLMIDPALRTGISAPDLASICFETLHPGSRSTLNRDTSKAHLYGLGMMQLSPTLFALRNQVPSVAAVRFKPCDIALFRLENDFRCWDGPHWPGMLIREGRFTFLASSDLAFQVNLMRPGKMNLANHAALHDALGPMVDRRHAARATIQAEAARTYMASIRTNRGVTL